MAAGNRLNRERLELTDRPPTGIKLLLPIHYVRRHTPAPGRKNGNYSMGIKIAVLHYGHLNRAISICHYKWRASDSICEIVISAFHERREPRQF